MLEGRHQIYRDFSKLLLYPLKKQDILQVVTELQKHVSGTEAQTMLETFKIRVQNESLGFIQEAYSEYFDFNLNSHLYIGTHLFGESYFRSGFIVKLKEQYKEQGFTSNIDELPDHLSVILEFLATNPEKSFEEELLALITQVLERIVKHIEQRAETTLEPMFKNELGLDQEGTSLETKQPKQLTKAPQQGNPYFHLLKAIKLVFLSFTSQSKEIMTNKI